MSINPYEPISDRDFDRVHPHQDVAPPAQTNKLTLFVLCLLLTLLPLVATAIAEELDTSPWPASWLTIYLPAIVVGLLGSIWMCWVAPQRWLRVCAVIAVTCNLASAAFTGFMWALFSFS
jgi:hypothetical protein